jgi:hypothetical protein
MHADTRKSEQDTANLRYRSTGTRFAGFNLYETH